jgi:hypothetical protein
VGPATAAAAADGFAFRLRFVKERLEQEEREMRERRARH